MRYKRRKQISQHRWARCAGSGEISPRRKLNAVSSSHTATSEFKDWRAKKPTHPSTRVTLEQRKIGKRQQYFSGKDDGSSRWQESPPTTVFDGPINREGHSVYNLRTRPRTLLAIVFNSVFNCSVGPHIHKFTGATLNDILHLHKANIHANACVWPGRAETYEPGSVMRD